MAIRGRGGCREEGGISIVCIYGEFGVDITGGGSSDCMSGGRW